MYKVIEHYPNYEVSPEGIVRNRTTGTNIRWQDDGCGYKMIKLYNEHTPKGRMCLIHRVVLSTYLPNDSNLDVNHIDGNKANNWLHNLEWVTKSENTKHAHKTGLFTNKLTIEQVQEIKKLLKTQDYSYSELGRKFGVRHSTIWKIANGTMYDYV